MKSPVIDTATSDGDISCQVKKEKLKVVPPYKSNHSHIAVHASMQIPVIVTSNSRREMEKSYGRVNGFVVSILKEKRILNFWSALIFHTL